MNLLPAKASVRACKLTLSLLVSLLALIGILFTFNSAMASSKVVQAPNLLDKPLASPSFVAQANLDSVVTFTLTAVITGTGGGTITVLPSENACSDECTFDLVAGDPVTLTAQANSGSTFTGWSGDCAGTDPCNLTMDANKAVTATYAINTYTLSTTIPSGHGSTSFNPPGGVYTHGTEVTVSLLPDTGWEPAGINFQHPPYCNVHWTFTYCTITMTGDQNFEVNYRIKTFYVWVTTEGQGSTSLTPSTIYYFDYGTPVTVTATPATGWHFVNWTGPCNSTVNNDCVMTMTSDRQVKAKFAINQYALTTASNGTGSGSLTKDPATGPYNHGTSVTVTPTANSDSDFVGWAGACSGNGACSMTMDSVKTVTATFDLKEYALTVNKVGNGTTSVASGTEFAHGTVVTVTATPDSHWHFTGWTGDCTGSGDCVVTMDAAKSVTATFEINTYALTVNTAGTGSGSTSVASGTEFAYGTEVTVTVTPNTGSHFVGWTGDCSGDEECEMMMDAAKSVTATFDLNIYTILTSKIGTGGGLFTIDPPTGPYTHGTVVTVTAVANIGSLFSGWGGDCTGTGSCTFTIGSNKDIVATFDLQNHTLTTATDGTGGGTITTDPSGSTFVNGTVVTATATANVGSHFVGWAGDCAGSGACVLTMDAAKSITATFDLDEPAPPITHTLSVALAGNGSGLVTSDPSGIDCGEVCSVSVEEGSVITLAVTISSGTIFSGWEGAECGDAPVCAITMTASALVTATFDLESFEIVVPGPDDIEGGTIEVRVVDEGEMQSVGAVTSYPYGTVLELTAVPDEGMVFSGWTGDLAGYGTENPIQITVTGPIDMGATFALIEYHIFLPAVTMQDSEE